jgi:GNAT superfamily N-acetyltransferase
METGSAERVLEIRRITYDEILDAPNAGALFKEYGEECSIPEIGEPNPQRAMYAWMEKADLMHSFGAYESGELVGFATVLVSVLPHYGKKIANMESFFLGQSHRRGNAGRTFMAWLEAFAKEMECAALLYNARAGSSLEKLLGAIPEYQRTNSVFLWKVSQS